jgi:hypothetical protein
MGVPGTDTETGLRLNTLGTIFYVDPNYPGASDQRDGTNPTDPLLTVAAALTKCQPYCGDVIAVMANGDWQYSGHVGRQVTISEAVTVSTPGVRIVGVAPSSPLGVYWQPPANDGVCITVNALDVTIEGFAFWNEDFTGGTGIFAQWTGLAAPDLQGENMIVRHCFFGGDLDYGIALDYAWYTYIHDNYFIGVDIAAIHNVDTTGDPDFSQIYRNHFVNNALAISLPGVSCCMIYDNWIVGDPTTADSYINTSGAGGGGNMVSRNSLESTLAQYVGGNCNSNAGDGWVQNYCVDGPSVALP